MACLALVIRSRILGFVSWMLAEEEESVTVYGRYQGLCQRSERSNGNYFSKFDTCV